jgi:hypothetical protein
MLKIPLLAFFELVMPSRIKAGIMMAARTCHGTNNCTSKGSFYTNHGSFTIDTNNGCRSISAPAMTELCMDWEGNRMQRQALHGQGCRDMRGLRPGPHLVVLLGCLGRGGLLVVDACFLFKTKGFLLHVSFSLSRA